MEIIDIKGENRVRVFDVKVLKTNQKSHVHDFNFITRLCNII